MQKLEGILFDKDGTVLSFNEIWGSWCEAVVQRLAPENPVLQKQLAEAGGYDLEHRVFAPGSAIVSASADETAALWAGLVDLSADQIEQIGIEALDSLPLAPVTDLDKVFTELKSFGLKLGIATNDYESAAHQHLQGLSVDHYFDFVCGFDSGYGVKPAPGMITAFCEHTQCDVSSVAMVGDSTHDLHAGIAAGAGLVVGVLSGPATAEHLTPDAHVVLPDISDLPRVLQQRGLI